MIMAVIMNFGGIRNGEATLMVTGDGDEGRRDGRGSDGGSCGVRAVMVT